MREHYTIDLTELEAIVKSLQAPTKRNQPRTTESYFSKALADGFAFISDIEDIFYTSDDRLGALCHALPVERWCEILSIPVRDYYRRPRRKQSSVTGFRGVSVDGLADLLLTIESIGYSIDPLSLVAKVSSSLVDRAFVNDAELSALWYSKTRHKTRISFRVGPDEMGQGWRDRSHLRGDGRSTIGEMRATLKSNAGRDMQASEPRQADTSRPENRRSQAA